MWKWFYSYTAALLLPVMFGIILYLFSVHTIVEQGEQLQIQNTEKDYHYLKQTLEGIASNAQNIMLNDEVRYFSGRRSFLSKLTIFPLFRQKILGIFSHFERFCLTCRILFEKLDFFTHNS